MGATKHIKRVLFEKEMKAQDLAQAWNKPAQTLYNQMQRDTWKYSDVEKVADLLGCDIVFIDRQTKNIY